jgi:hypothetical protein
VVRVCRFLGINPFGFERRTALSRYTFVKRDARI